MVTLVQQKAIDAKEAKKKGLLAAGVTGAGAVAALALTPWVGVPVAGYGAWLGWKWFVFRVEKGLRF